MNPPTATPARITLPRDHPGAQAAERAGLDIVSKGGGVPWRMKIRSPSFCSLSIMPKIGKGVMMSDLVAILGSPDFVMGECDR
jgi:NADH:ubiquinone oxidoreductase subunit D